MGWVQGSNSHRNSSEGCRARRLPVDAVREAIPCCFVFNTSPRDDIEAAGRIVTFFLVGEGISGRNQNPIHEWPAERTKVE